MARQDEYDDERVVVLERDGKAGVGMLLLGLALGAGAALLFAPATGEETRERLRGEARRAGRKVKDVADAFGDQVTEKVGRTRSRFDAQVERARDAVGSRVSAVGEALDAGRSATDDAREDLERAVADAKRAYADSRRAYREARFARSRPVTEHDDVALESPAAMDHDDADGAATEG